MVPRFREYEVKKLRFPACCRQENTIFPPHIHRTWGPPFSPSLYLIKMEKSRGEAVYGMLGWTDDRTILTSQLTNDLERVTPFLVTVRRSYAEWALDCNCSLSVPESGILDKQKIMVRHGFDLDKPFISIEMSMPSACVREARARH